MHGATNIKLYVSYSNNPTLQITPPLFYLSGQMAQNYHENTKLAT